MPATASTGDGNKKPGKGNRRTGRVRGYNGQKGGSRTIPWDKDPFILARINVGMKAWHERNSPDTCLSIVNGWIADDETQQVFPSEPSVSLPTIYRDREHGMELRQREAAASADLASKEILGQIDHAINQAWIAFHSAGAASLNRSGYISNIGSLIERKAKLLGLLSKTVTIDAEADEGPVTFTVNIGEHGPKE